jgi:hypothetical protein
VAGGLTRVKPKAYGCVVSDDRTPSDDSGDSELAAYGQAVDVAVHVPTLSGALAAGTVAAIVWIWRQLRHGRAAAMSRRR